MDIEKEKLSEGTDPDFITLDREIDLINTQLARASDFNSVYDPLIFEADAEYFEKLDLKDPNPDDSLVREWLRDTPEVLLELRMQRARREHIRAVKNIGITLATVGLCATVLIGPITDLIEKSRKRDTPEMQRKNLSPSLEGLRKNIRKSVINLLVQPYFSGTYLLGKLTDVEGARLEWQKGTDLYVSIPAKAFRRAFSTKSMNEVIGKITRNPEVAPGEWAEYRKPAKVKDMTLSLEAGSEPVFFISLPEDDLWIDPDQPLHHPYGPYVYDPTPRELYEAPVIGGKIHFYPGNGDRWANHGAFIATSQNSPMKRLAHQIIGEEKDPHQIAQKILDFVHQYVPYNFQEANIGGEVLRHGHDILMTGQGGDCSTQTIVFASLLEQVRVDYLLAYRLTNPGHITVYVQWEKPCTSRDIIELNGKRYTRAEETSRGFVIGRSRIPDDEERHYVYIQKPSSQTIINRSTGKVIDVR